jgi:hypothetical protein
MKTITTLDTIAKGEFVAIEFLYHTALLDIPERRARAGVPS